MGIGFGSIYLVLPLVKILEGSLGPSFRGQAHHKRGFRFEHAQTKTKKKERKILMKPCFHFTNDLGVYLLKSKERLDASTFFSLQVLLQAGKTFTIDFFV